MLDEFNESMRRIEDSLEKKRLEFERRAADLPDMPLPGDTVVLVAGLLGRGHMWERIEGICIAVGTNSAKVEFQMRHDKEPIQEWVHPAVISDVIATKMTT